MNKIEFIKRGFSKKCPVCGRSPIFIKYVKTFSKCKNCGTKLSNYKSDDGPAYITILIIGHLIIPIILLIEKHYSPALLIQMTFWPILTILLCLWLLPRIKGAFIGIQIFLDDKSG